MLSTVPRTVREGVNFEPLGGVQPLSPEGAHLSPPCVVIHPKFQQQLPPIFIMNMKIMTPLMPDCGGPSSSGMPHVALSLSFPFYR